jgi:hypothetical protein
MGFWANFQRRLVVKRAYELMKTLQFKKLRVYEKELINLREQADLLLKHKTIELLAYSIAEKNNFAGNSEFYWCIANDKLKNHHISATNLISQYELLIRDKLAYIRYKSINNKVSDLSAGID